MIELDPSLLAPEITYAIMLRGTRVPPLFWTERRQDTARHHLEDHDNIRLFGRVTFANEEMAHAVRAMLYLWHGWIQECAIAARSAGNKEKHYLTALCYRQVANAAAAKTSFQSMDGHPVFEKLAQAAVEHIGRSDARQDKTIGRFKQIMEFDPVWEPYAFIDIVEAARAGKFDHTGEDLVRTLQCLEWEILFKHCYEEAVGKEMSQAAGRRNDGIDRHKTRDRELEEEKRREQRYKLDELQRENSTAATKSGPGSSPGPGGSKTPPLSQPPPPNTIPMACPACGHMQRVAESARGQAVRCSQCERIYSIPHTSEASA